MTICGHYFCGQCALDGTKTAGNKCPICNKQTFGVFNRAHKLLKKIAAKKGIPVPSTSDLSTTSDGITAVKSNVAMMIPRGKRGSWEEVDT